MRLTHPVRDLDLWIMRVRPSPAYLPPGELSDKQALVWQDGDLHTLFTVGDTEPPTYTLTMRRASTPHEERSKMIVAAYVAAMGRPPDHSRQREAVVGGQAFHDAEYRWFGSAIHVRPFE